MASLLWETGQGQWGAEPLPSWVTSREKEEKFPERFWSSGRLVSDEEVKTRTLRPSEGKVGRWAGAALSSRQGKGATALVLGTGLALRPGSPFNSSVTDK